MSTKDGQELVVAAYGIDKCFRDFWRRPKVHALKGVDLEIPKGSIFGLLGPNGSGKSTLIKIILGQLYPDKGQLTVFGQSPRSVESKLRLAYLPERSYLYKHLTARETLDFFGKVLGLSKEEIEKRSEQLLDMVGLKAAADRQVGQFSHGMTRRMGLAQALLNDPEFIILDEPTAGLDPIGCHEVKELIRTLGQRGKTVLMTTHLLSDLEEVCTDLQIIYGGETCSQGKAEDLLKNRSLTQIQIPTPQTTESKKRILQGLKSEFSEAEVNITSPSISLEDFFLQAIDKSLSKEGFSSSGAQLGSGVADYLQSSTEEKPSTTDRQENIWQDLWNETATPGPQEDLEFNDEPCTPKTETLPEHKEPSHQECTGISEEASLSSNEIPLDTDTKIDDAIQSLDDVTSVKTTDQTPASDNVVTTEAPTLKSDVSITPVTKPIKPDIIKASAEAELSRQKQSKIASEKIAKKKTLAPLLNFDEDELDAFDASLIDQLNQN